MLFLVFRDLSINLFPGEEDNVCVKSLFTLTSANIKKKNPDTIWLELSILKRVNLILRSLI